ncbi:MAG: GTPase ObgE [Candidatus Moranbacteria bacterium]|nr:GTPase ObgE [Candidatus Moranbacteria bacterium]
MLIDEVTIDVKAGHGGNGVVRFTKTKMSQGPTGGNGGRGGNVVAHAVADLGALRQFRTKKEVEAEDGKDGGQNTKTGADGKTAIFLVPVGTILTNTETGEKIDMTHPGQEVVVARGGNGGFGNYHFRSSRNTTPMRANDGKHGEEKSFTLELKMIADVGFVGLPNIGKSSLLNELTNASSKVANYQFTTLEPSLGVYYDLVLADIPGLIEGASEGKGLGYKFLRHIERTRVLFHFVTADTKDPLGDYQTIRQELEKYNPTLAQKPEWIIISRSDEVGQERIQEIRSLFAKEKREVTVLSLLDEESVKEVKKLLNHITEEYVTKKDEEDTEKEGGKEMTNEKTMEKTKKEKAQE